MGRTQPWVGGNDSSPLLPLQLLPIAVLQDRRRDSPEAMPAPQSQPLCGGAQEAMCCVCVAWTSFEGHTSQGPSAAASFPRTESHAQLHQDWASVFREGIAGTSGASSLRDNSGTGLQDEANLAPRQAPTRMPSTEVLVLPCPYTGQRSPSWALETTQQTRKETGTTHTQPSPVPICFLLFPPFLPLSPPVP